MEREQMRGKVCISINGDVIHRYAWFNERFERLPDSTAEKEILSVIENDTESLERACDVIDDLASLDNGLEFGSIPPQQVNKVVNAALDNVNEVLTVGQEVECKITEVDLDKKRISLSIRALLPEEAEEEETETEVETEAEAEETAAEAEPAQEAPEAE